MMSQKDNILRKAILFLLSLGCLEETLCIASIDFSKDIVDKLAIHCCQWLSNSIRERVYVQGEKGQNYMNTEIK